jgi:hypothetical protein
VNDCFLHISSYAHAMLVEQVMAMHGRGSSDPKQYRRTLECMSSAALRRAIEESDFPDLETEAFMKPAGESPAQFPASAETTDDIQRAIRRTGASTPAREVLTTDNP